MPRMTIDWDLFIPPRDLENFRILNAALDEERDIEVVPLGPNGEHFIQTFQTQWAILQFHLGVPGVPSYEEAERLAVEVTDGDVKIKRLCGAHLLAAKEKADRPKDQDDLLFLRMLKTDGKLV